MHIRVAHISEQRSYFTNFAPMHFVVEVKFRTMFRNVLLACLFVQAAKQTAGKTIDRGRIRVACGA